jgi:type VI secretion system secreted protein VgrG
VIAQKASDFTKDGPATLSVDLPSFSEGSPERKFQLRFGEAASPLAPLTGYEIDMTDGSTQAGTSDAEGNTGLLERDAMHIANIRLLNNKT